LAEEPRLTAAKVAVGSIYLTAQNILSTAIGALGLALMARLITREEMGVIAGLTFLASLIQLVSSLGLNVSLAKFVSELKGRNEDISTHVLSAISLRIPPCILIASILTLFPTEISLLLFKTPTYSNTIRLLALDSILLSISPLLNSTLWGSGKLKNIAIYRTLSTAIRWLSILAFLTGKLGLNGVIYGWILSDITLLLMFSLSTIKLITPKKHLLRNSIKYLPKLLTFSWPIYLASIVTFLYTWYDRAIILTFLPLSDLGIYNIAYTAFTVLTSIATSLGSALLPYCGMAYGRKDHKAISSSIKRASRYTMLIMFPLTIGLAATAKPIITLFAGKQYEQGWQILAILSLFGVIYGLSPAFSNLLLIYEKTKTILLLSFVPIASSLTLLPLLQTLNLTGLAIMRGTSLLTNFLLTLYFISKIIKVEIERKTLLKSITSSIIMASTIIILQALTYNPTLTPIYILLGAITYIASIRTLKTLNKEDMQLIQQIMGKKHHKYLTKILGL